MDFLSSAKNDVLEEDNDINIIRSQTSVSLHSQQIWIVFEIIATLEPPPSSSSLPFSHMNNFQSNFQKKANLFIHSNTINCIALAYGDGIMKTSKLFLASMVLIAIVCLYNVQGQYTTTDTYSSSISTTGSTSSESSQNGQYYLMPTGQALSAFTEPAISQAPADLVGTVLSIKDENSMNVNVTKSNISGIEGATLILLPRPVPMKDLLYFQGKELSFSLLGHDILGRPICDAYFNGIAIANYASRYGYHSPEYGYYAPGYGYYSPEYGYYAPGYEYYSSRSLDISVST